MIIGDYFGEWLDAEMKEMLGVMLDTMKGYDFKSRGEDNQTGGGSGPQHRTYNAVGSPTYQDAWDYMTAAADSFWPIITSSTDGDPFLAKTVPFQTTHRAAAMFKARLTILRRFANEPIRTSPASRRC
jgi:hypothetical protein